MAAVTILATLLMAQAPAYALAPVDVAYDELAAQRNAAAIARIESNADLDEADPARLINLGVAHARQGRADAARELFERAAIEAERLNLETATGEWIDSRALARRALAALDRGEFAAVSRTAMR